MEANYSNTKATYPLRTTNLPECFQNPLGITLFEAAPSNTQFIQHFRNSDRLAETFAQTYGNLTFTLAKPEKEAEYGICVKDSNALIKIPNLLSQNRHTTLDQKPNRHYTYLTITLKHQNPDHPLNNQYVAQWRIHVDPKVKNELSIIDSKICVKPRNKDIVREEFERDTNCQISEQLGFSMLQTEYGDKLPNCLIENSSEIASQLYVSGISVTSRTGYIGFQLRKKFSSHVLHEFSHDYTLTTSPRILKSNGKLIKLADRFEVEDEIKGALIATGIDINVSDLNTSMIGALDIHRGIIMSNTNRCKTEPKISSISKSIFAEHAAQGNLKNAGANPGPHINSDKMTEEEVKSFNLKTEDLFSNPKLKHGLKLLVKEIPKQHNFYPSQNDFTPNKPFGL